MRRYGWTIGGVMAGCLLAGCSALPGLGGKASPPASTTATPARSGTPAAVRAVSDREATAILADYVKRNNAANKARSEKLLAGYEGGSSYAIDKASYASSRVLHKTITYQPFGYAKPVFHVPAAGQRPWFLATAHWQRGTTTDKEPTYLLFARQGDGWRQMYSPDTFAGTAAGELPEIAVDASGLAAEVAPTDATGLLMSPADFAGKYAAHLAGKGSAADRSLFAADRITTQAASTRIRMNQYAHSTVTARPAGRYPSYTLRTADGGALTFTTIERTIRYDVRPGPERNYVFQKDSGILRGKYYTYMTITDLFQVVARIPPKKADPDQVKVIASYSGLVAGGGR
ncbi:hypothetical protein [Nonomuraea roseoviolacea]|uniref:DUF8094 domain-containing protein n=1 Tax=Nonomuraea roseoviolacea subsp. carminata TaxID=160689 RepID=A0ABT1K0S3_9ACTN|nr:hypothetical protein [Nonomuraea roseoviolacea]MCP2347262.1 hypothetical protein [Nonomuraea roseoviolacea subsp. carminata]